MTYTQFDCVDLIWPIFSGGSTELNCKSIIARDFIRSLSNWGLVTNWYRVYRVQKNQEKKKELFSVSHFYYRLHAGAEKKLKFLEFLISFQALWVVIATIQLYKYPNCHKLQRRRNTNELMTLYNDVMPIWVVKFRGYGYKLKYIFGQKSTYYVGHCIL